MSIYRIGVYIKRSSLILSRLSGVFKLVDLFKVTEISTCDKQVTDYRKKKEETKIVPHLRIKI